MFGSSDILAFKNNDCNGNFVEFGNNKDADILLYQKID